MGLDIGTLAIATTRTTPRNITMRVPPIRLAFGPVFWRLSMIVFALKELASWKHVRPWLIGAPPSKYVAALIYITPQSILIGFLIGFAVTLGLAILVKLLAGPIAARWYAPAQTGSELTPLPFHLETGESMVAEAPARRRSARGWKPGTLILTDRRLWFFPTAWDLEPWSVPVADLASIRNLRRRTLTGPIIRGVPDSLRIRGRSGEDAVFAVAEPKLVRGWFNRPSLDHCLVARPAKGPNAFSDGKAEASHA
jgi:hypothetical protein